MFPLRSHQITRRDFLRTGAVGSLTLPTLLRADSPGADTNWPGWRGPTGAGISSEKDLPLTWGGPKSENIRWKTALGGTGNSSPIVRGDRVFVTTAAKQTREEEAKKLVPEHHVVCLSTADGSVVWRTQVPQGEHAEGYEIYAVPTPVTDGNRVYAWFGSGVLAAVDFAGKLLWRVERKGPFKLNPGICSSPVLYKDTVILLFDQGGGLGMLQAIDAATGEVRWEKKRAKESVTNTTPLLIRVGDRDQLVIAASNALQGVDPATGDVIWWAKANGFGASPAYGGGLVYVDHSDALGIAVEPGGEGDVSKTRVKWQVPKVKAEYSSPVISGGYVFRSHKPAMVSCRSLETGAEAFSERLDKVSFLASPVATAGGRVYFASAEKTYVLKAGPKLDVLAANEIKGASGGNAGASPAVSNGRIYLRDRERLYCIG